MKLKSIHLSILIFVVIFGGISITSALQLWKTTNDKTPASYKEGKFAGQYNPADIRGSYTFENIENSFKVPLEDLGKAFGVKDPASYAEFQCKELEALYASLAAEGKEVGTGSVRYFVALYKGLPIEVEEGTYLPSTAVEILKAKAKLSEEQIKHIDSHSVVLPAEGVNQPQSTTKTDTSVKSSESSGAVETAPKPAVTDPAKQPKNPTAEGTASTEKAIKGSTTFKDLIDWGVKKEDIEKELQDKMPDSQKLIKDYATSKGVEFSTIKTALQKLVDATKK